MRSVKAKNKKITCIVGGTVVLLVVAFLLVFFAFGTRQRYTLYFDGEEVAVAKDKNQIEDAMRDARIAIGQENEGIILIDAEFVIKETTAFFCMPNSKSEIEQKIEEVFRQNEEQTLSHSYTVKINNYTTNLATVDEVIALLQGSVKQYDEENQFEVELVLNGERELNVLTAVVNNTKVEETEVQAGGFEHYLEMMDQDELAFDMRREFSDYTLGLQDVHFANSVEVVESYLLDSQLASVDVAIEEVTKKLEKEEIYEVSSGDTLSGIAIATNIPLETLIQLNPTLENENSLIRIGDELIITVPEPELTVMHTSENYYEEEYEADIIYVDNDKWYTTDQVTLEQPSTGRRNVVAVETYENDKLISREILKEEVLMEAVPKVVERGTIIPPTYIKPLSGGIITSYFGYRNIPTAGATAYHGAIDWATPIGTPIVASCAGTVTRAGWASGYGYAVYIRHDNGRETRYAHLSRVLVSAGQYVQQGQKIALSGNTGISTGPHIHFELRFNGTPVDPLKYLE